VKIDLICGVQFQSAALLLALDIDTKETQIVAKSVERFGLLRAKAPLILTKPLHNVGRQYV
jgi:hypothetical protein